MPAHARRLLVLLAALATVLLAGGATIAASALAAAGAQNGVWAQNQAAPEVVGLGSSESFCTRPGSTGQRPGSAAGFCVAAEGVAANIAAGGENSAAALGRYVHSLAKADPGSFYGPGTYSTEASIYNSEGRVIARADAIDYQSNTIYELKPNNPRALATGQRQVNGYAELLGQQTGEQFTGRVIPYDPGAYHLPSGR